MDELRRSSRAGKDENRNDARNRPSNSPRRIRRRLLKTFARHLPISKGRWIRLSTNSAAKHRPTAEQSLLG